MLWGPNQQPTGAGSDSQGAAPSPQARPASAPGSMRTPAPPYSPAAARAQGQSVVQRLNEARASTFSPRTPRAPDGAPAPIPGVLAGAGGVARVTQRFTGVGVSQRSESQRDENRARVATILLALLAILLIIASALLLFNPFMLRLSFGFNPGQRIVETHSNVPLIITRPHQQTPTPQPTAQPTAASGSGAHATATAGPNGTPVGGPGPTATVAPTPKPTATSAPTPTPLPSPSPTIAPTATVVTGPVTVTFTAAKQTQSFSGAMNACPSCEIATPIQTASSSTYTGTVWVTGGMNSTYWADDLWVTNPTSSALPTKDPLNGCTSNAVITVPANSGAYLQCVIKTWTTVSGGYNGLTYKTTYGPYTDYSNTYVTASDCTNAKNSATSQAQNWLNGYKAPQPGAITSTSISTSGCNPAIGTYEWQVYKLHNQRLSTSATAVGHASYETFTWSQAMTRAATHLALTSGNWAWKSGTLAGCSPQSMTPPPSGSNVMTVVCGITQLEYFSWSSSEKAQVASALAGQPLSNASSICDGVRKSVEGIAPTTTCTVSFSGGSTLPPASSFTVVVNTP